MKALWQKTSDMFDARVMRERIIIAGCMFAVVYGIFYYGFFFPLDLKKSAIEKRLENVGREHEKLTAQEVVFSKAISNDPNADKKRELARLSQQLKNLDEDLIKLSVGLISAEQLPIALRDVLIKTKGLELLGLETQLPTKLTLTEPPRLNVPSQNPEESELERAESLLEEVNSNSASEENNAGSSENGVGLYKHSVKLAIEGEYFSIVDYLRSIEELPWKIYWQSLDYHVDAYPGARVVLEVYTLSTEKSLIGG